MSPDAHAIRQGWLDVLSEMEAGLATDAALLEGDIVSTRPTAWSSPQHLGPIPIDLRERADSILAELAASSLRLTELRIATGQQLAAVRSIPSPRSAKSIYLDVTA